MGRLVPAMRLTGVGFFIVACILLGTFGGLWLDGKLNTKPLFLLGGLLVGLAVAFYGVYHMIQPLLNNNRDKENG